MTFTKVRASNYFHQTCFGQAVLLWVSFMKAACTCRNNADSFGPRIYRFLQNPLYLGTKFLLLIKNPQSVQQTYFCFWTLGWQPWTQEIVMNDCSMMDYVGVSLWLKLSLSLSLSFSTPGRCSSSCFEPRKPWLVGFYRGLYYPVI